MEVEQEASAMGWQPQEQFKGKPEAWVDAATFVEKGQHIMPILRKNNERLLGDVTALKATVESLKSTVAASQESMEAMKTFHEESTRAQLEKARKDILAGLKQAKTDGDVDQEVELTATLSEFDSAQREAERKAKEHVAKPTPIPAPVGRIDPEVQAWMNDNPWYGVDQERTGLMEGVAKRLRAEGHTTKGLEFLEYAAQIVDARLGTPAARPQSKVEGSRGGSSSRSAGTDYASLPADARAECDRQSKKFVGEGRAFKDVKSWNTYFADLYNKQ